GVYLRTAWIRWSFRFGENFVSIPLRGLSAYSVVNGADHSQAWFRVSIPLRGLSAYSGTNTPVYTPTPASFNPLAGFICVQRWLVEVFSTLGNLFQSPCGVYLRTARHTARVGPSSTQSFNPLAGFICVQRHTQTMIRVCTTSFNPL